jgi:hypothetical protein
MIQRGEGLIEEAMAREQGWYNIDRDLLAEGLNDEEVAAVLRPQEAWVAEARQMKSDGFFYDEIICHLIALRASWADVGRALMAAGLSPADMLRAALPCTEGEEHWQVIQAALVDGPEDADYTEARGVLGFFFIGEEEVLGALELDEVQRRTATKRLGVQA